MSSEMFGSGAFLPREIAARVETIGVGKARLRRWPAPSSTLVLCRSGPTLSDLIGGSVLVGLVYWAIYLRGQKQ